MTFDRFDWRFVILSSASFVAILWVSGWTTPWIAPDTEGYLAVAPYPELYFQQRLPFFGWLANALSTSKSQHGMVIWFHLLLHVSAATMLYFAVRQLSAGRHAAIALFLAALISQGFLIFGRAVVPESPAVSLTLIAIAATLFALCQRHSMAYVLSAGLAASGAILLRPVFLPLVVALPVLFVIAGRVTRKKLAPARVLLLLAASVLPTTCYVLDRARHVDDVKLVAFGGFQMSAMAAFLLSQDVVDHLPPAARETAAQMLAARERGEATGSVLRTPLNSFGERSFMSAAVGYFDIYARTYDDLLYSEIAKLQAPNESWIQFDRRLQQFALQTILHAPERYAAWVAGASSRLAGRMLVTNAPFVAASAGFLAIFLIALFRTDEFGRPGHSSDALLVITVAGAYVLAAAPLTVLITFPASRYIDTAATLLPALPLFGAMRMLVSLRHP